MDAAYLVSVALALLGASATVLALTEEGPVLGALVYGSWMLWGLATLAVGGRLSSHRGAPVLPTTT